MFRTGSEMAGHLLLLAAMGLNARYVILDAQGLIVSPGPRKKAKEPDEDDAKEAEKEEVKATSPAGNRWRAIDPPHAARSRRINVLLRKRPPRPWPSPPSIHLLPIAN